MAGGEDACPPGVVEVPRLPVDAGDGALSGQVPRGVPGPGRPAGRDRRRDARTAAAGTTAAAAEPRVEAQEVQGQSRSPPSRGDPGPELSRRSSTDRRTSSSSAIRAELTDQDGGEHSSTPALRGRAMGWSSRNEGARSPAPPRPGRSSPGTSPASGARPAQRGESRTARTARGPRPLPRLEDLVGVWYSQDGSGMDSGDPGGSQLPPGSEGRWG